MSHGKPVAMDLRYMEKNLKVWGQRWGERYTAQQSSEASMSEFKVEDFSPQSPAVPSPTTESLELGDYEEIVATANSGLEAAVRSNFQPTRHLPSTVINGSWMGGFGSAYDMDSSSRFVHRKLANDPSMPLDGMPDTQQSHVRYYGAHGNTDPADWILPFPKTFTTSVASDSVPSDFHNLMGPSIRPSRPDLVRRKPRVYHNSRRGLKQSSGSSVSRSNGYSSEPQHSGRPGFLSARAASACQSAPLRARASISEDTLHRLSLSNTAPIRRRRVSQPPHACPPTGNTFPSLTPTSLPRSSLLSYEETGGTFLSAMHDDYSNPAASKSSLLFSSSDRYYNTVEDNIDMGLSPLPFELADVERNYALDGQDLSYMDGSSPTTKSGTSINVSITPATTYVDDMHTPYLSTTQSSSAGHLSLPYERLDPSESSISTPMAVDSLLDPNLYVPFYWDPFYNEGWPHTTTNP